MLGLVLVGRLGVEQGSVAWSEERHEAACQVRAWHRAGGGHPCHPLVAGLDLVARVVGAGVRAR
jgi:hypothetical protein